MPLHDENRLGVPTFLWVSPSVGKVQPAFRPGADGVILHAEDAARSYLGLLAPLYNLSPDDVASANLRYVHDIGHGAVIVKLQQNVGGVEIFREEINVVMNRKLDLIAVTGYISSMATPPTQSGLDFRLGEPTAAITAVRDVTLANVNGGQFVAAGSHDGYDYFTLPASSGAALSEPVRMKKVFFHLPEGLVPAYYTEVIAQAPSSQTNILAADGGPVMDVEGYGYVISAVDGSILWRKNLTADAKGPQGEPALGPGGFTYRVWADPVTGVPHDTPAGNAVHPKIIAAPDGTQYPFIAPSDVTLPNYPFSMNDPWLAPGATETSGNNVDAFLNLFTPDGYGNPITAPADPPTGDYRGNITAPGQFLHTHTPDVNSTALADARQGAIQQLFYNNNFLHDWYYDSGFNEASGNAQTNNFGRGGLGNDNIKAQADDFQSFSNANMLTPADGTRPRMRMYVFPSISSMLDVSAPASAVGKYQVGISMSGPQAFDLNGKSIIKATFVAGTCNVTNAASLVPGTIAMFDFDNTDGTGCSFSTRIARLTTQTTTDGILMIYTSGSPTVVANITGFVTANTKPVATTAWNTGQIIKTALALPSAVTARLLRFPDRDGTIDNQIVFHEWGHYISNRLIGNGTGIITQQSGSMGEGWGDFNAMLLTVRADDTSTPSNATWNGAYALATYATSGVPFNGSLNDGYYYGIRRYPYSTDMAINPLTFKHVANGVALPVGPPVAFGASGASNAEVHNSGEVWANMLWECYASLLRDTQGGTPRLTFTQAQLRMRDYIVASYKMSPYGPTFLEQRDAVLAAAYATDIVDYVEFWQAFAKRGAGIGAIAPPRYSGDHVGAVENFSPANELLLVDAVLDDSVSSCDADGSLDAGDTGKVKVTLRNLGGNTLTATTGSISTTNPNVTFAGGGAISFPSSIPYGTTIGYVNATMAPGTVGIQQIDCTINFDDPGLGVAGPRVANVTLRGNTNTQTAVTATDGFESTRPIWTSTITNTLPPFSPFWHRNELTITSHNYFVADGDHPSDSYLTSPVMTIGAGGTLQVELDHSWAFEFDGGGNYDGGRIEMSKNGGPFASISDAVDNGTLTAYAGNANPLQGLSAFVANGGPVHTVMNPAVIAGDQVQIRFRSTSDNSGGATGWSIDNVQFTGITTTPFDTVSTDVGCTAATTTVLGYSPPSPTFGAPLTLTATVSSPSSTPTGGSVSFYDGPTLLGSGAMTSGTAQLITSSLSVGPHTLSAVYGGAAGYAGSTSGNIIVTISKAATSTGIVADVNPQAIGSPVTFTATVTGGVGTPTGSVTFTDGVTPIGTVALAGGLAQLTTSSLTGGTHTIGASYTGNATYLGSSNSMVENITTGSTIAFNPTAYWKFEDTTMVTLTVTRTGGVTTGMATVQYATSPGTAVANVRYTTSSGTVTFNNNVTSTTLDIPLNDTAAIEGMQNFTVTLSNPNAAVLGAAVATVNIMDDDIGESDFSSPSNGGNDIVWRNETTGDTRAWEMNATTFVSSTNLLQFGGNWRLAAVADFNQDGHADILYRNAADFSMVIWYMNGTNLISTGSTPSVPDANWKVVAAGDLNGDGFPDIVWRNSSTFTMTAWLMRDNVMLSVASLPTVPDANWNVKGLGDFNRDGKLDLVWRNEVGFQTAVWLMNGTTFSSAVSLPTVGAPWNLVGVGDMNSDGDSDLIWRTSTGSNTAVWIMNQTSFSSAVAIPSIVDTNWQIVAPR